MIRFFIENEEIVCSNKIKITEEMLTVSSTILNNCYPLSWEKDKDYVSKFYIPKDYSKCSIYDYDKVFFDKLLQPIYGKSIQNKEPSIDNPQEIKTIKGILNLFDTKLFGNFTASLKYINITLKANTTYTMSSNLPRANSATANLFFYRYGESPTTGKNSVSPNENRTLTTDDTGKVVIAYRNHANSLTNVDLKNDYWYMLNEGNYAEDYVSFGEWFKIKHTNKNICLTDFDCWESGHYAANGNKQNNVTRIRLKDLIKVNSNSSYYVNTFSNRDVTFIFRTYDRNKNFIRSIGTIGDNESLKLRDNDYYLSVSIGVTPNSQLTINSFNDYKNYFDDGTIKPFICLNSEEDKSFVEHKEEELTIDMSKKNFMDVRDYVEKNSDYYTIDEDENVTCIKVDNRSGSFTYYIELPLGTYTLCTTNPCNLRVFESDDNSFPSMPVTFQRNGKNNIVFTTTKPFVAIKTFSNTLPYEIGKIHLFEGSNADEYYELASIDDVKDELQIDDTGNVTLVKKVEKIIMDDSRNYQLSSLDSSFECTRFRTTQLIPNNVLEAYAGISDKFITRLPNTPSADYEYIMFDKGHFYFAIKKSRLTENTGAAFKKWIGENPTIVYYKLNEIKVINLGKVAFDMRGELLFAGVVKNTGNITLNPRYPKTANLQVLGYKTFLSEGETLDFVISNKTIEEAIRMTTNAISKYGFVVGNINLKDSNEIIEVYSTLDKSAYDVYQYISEITGSVWYTRRIDENNIAIDFYDPELLPKAQDIKYTKKYFEENNIQDDISVSYSTSDYRNKQIIKSKQVYSNIVSIEQKISDGYNNEFFTEKNIGMIKSIKINDEFKTFATNNEKDLGFLADFYYSVGESKITADKIYAYGTSIIIEYIAIVPGREIAYNNLEINRISEQLGISGVISRYEDRNDVLYSNQLNSIAKSCIRFKGEPDFTITISSTNKNLFFIGQQVYFDAPIEILKRDYMVRSKTIEICSSGIQQYVFYTFKLTSNYNAETSINFFDNQRRKANGNISQGEYISRNIDLEDTTNILFSNLKIEEINIDDNLGLETVLESIL